MSGTVRTFATLAIGGCLGLVLGFAATLSVAPALVRDTPPVVSNASAKQDRLDRAARPARAPAVAASRIESEGAAGPVVTLLDRDGRMLFRHDPDARETTVLRDSLTDAPAVSGLRMAEADSAPARARGRR